MAMFGNSARKFDPAALPGPADPIAALATPQLQPGPMPTLDTGVPTQRRGLDSHAIAGIASDFLGGMVGRQPLYAEQQAKQHLYSQNKQDQWTTWLAQQQYAAAHPKPVNNDTVNDYNFIAQKIGPDAARQYLTNISEGPPVAVDVAAPDGSVTRQFLPRTSFGQKPSSGPPIGTVSNGYRFKGGDPNSQASWEAIGGPTPPASGTFP